MYDIKQVTRYVLVRSKDGYNPAEDLAEFRRRDEAEAVLAKLNGPFEDERAAARQYVAQRIRDGNPLYVKAPTEYDRS